MGMRYLFFMPRKMTYPERAQANVPEGTLERLNGAALPGEEIAGTIRRALLEWLARQEQQKAA